jgi:hypothetical protein
MTQMLKKMERRKPKGEVARRARRDQVASSSD